MTIAMILDLVVAGLLVATIAYAIILNRRLAELRGGSAQMERLINDFYHATTRAESGVTALREATEHSDDGIIGQLESLTKLRDELEFLVSRAETQCAQLDGQIRQGRDDPVAKILAELAESETPVGQAVSKMAPDTDLDTELFGAPSSDRNHDSRSQGSGAARPTRAATPFVARDLR